MPIDLSAESRPVDAADPRYAAMLANLQGNILKSHGRDYAFHIFFRFAGDSAAARGLVAALSSRVTSAAEQARQTAEFSRGGAGGVFGALMLSAKGLAVMGRPLPAGFGEAKAAPAATPAVSAARPMKAAAAALGDDPALWDESFREGDIDGLLILAAGKEMAPFGPDAIPTALLEASRAAQDAILAGGGLVAGLEIGQQQRRGEDAVEHFGYVDGISQPILVKQDLPAPDKMTRNDPSAGLSLALVADPLTDEADSFGSFYVFRKLEQNVAAFRAAEKKLAADLALADPKLAEGMIVGRFRNGAPVVLAGADVAAEAKENDFDYAGDPSPATGLPAKCPFHAHIRKTNPRGDIDRQFGAADQNAGERARRIVRRGITYGARDADIADAPTGGVGLLFQCYQASIPDQFAFMQNGWANNADFVRPGATGQDPVIGQGKRTTGQTWSTSWGGAGRKTTRDIGQFVTNRGGEFFFAPSLPFFRSLA